MLRVKILSLPACLLIIQLFATESTWAGKKQEPGSRPGYKTKFVPDEFALVEISCLSELQNLNSISDITEFITTLKRYYTNGHSKRLAPYNRENKALHHCLLEIVSFWDFKEILEFSNRDVCHPDHIHLMERFHFRHVSAYEHKRHKFKPLLRDLFKTYALQVSAICKKNLIMNVENKAKELILMEDYQLLLPWKYNLQQSPPTIGSGHTCPLIPQQQTNYVADLMKIIGEFETKLSDFDDIMLMSSISDTRSFASTRLVDLEEEENIKISISTKSNDALRKMLDVCQHKFRPIYHGTIITVLRLSRLGYSFQGSLLKRELAQLQTSDLVRKWYTITQLCEALDQIILEPTTTTNDGEGDTAPVELTKSKPGSITFTIGMKEHDPTKREVSRDESMRNIVFEDNKFSNELWIRREIEFGKLLVEKTKEKLITISTIKLITKTWQLFGLYLKNRLFTIRTKTSKHYDNPQQNIIDTISRGVDGNNNNNNNQKSVDIVKALKLSITDSQGVGVVRQLFSTIISLLTASVVSVVTCFYAKIQDYYHDIVYNNK